MRLMRIRMIKIKKCVRYDHEDEERPVIQFSKDNPTIDDEGIFFNYGRIVCQRHLLCLFLLRFNLHL
jgi:hypothetical protein